MSNESGRNEVYVAPFPGPGGKRQVSLAGGAFPRWRANTQLVRKHYLVSEDGRECAGLYIWPTRADGEAAQTGIMRRRLLKW